MEKRNFKIHNNIRYKYQWGLIIFATLLSIAASTIGYFEFKTNFEEQYKDRAYTISKIIASQVRGDVIDIYLRGEAHQPPPVITTTLKPLWNELDVWYISLSGLDGHRVRFIYIKEGESSGSVVGSPSVAETVSQAGEEYHILNDKRGAIGVSVPIYDQKGSVVGSIRTVIGLDVMKKGLLRYVMETILSILILTTVITTWYIGYVNRNVVEPLESITLNALAFASSNYEDLPSFTFANTHDEIGELARSVSKMASDIKEYILNIRNNIAEKEKMGAELRVAKEIQHSLLPKRYPAENEIDLFAMMNSAKEVGGDFYDFFEAKANSLTVVIGDVSGKGIPAAMFMTTVKELIKHRSTDGNPPHRVFEIANNKLIESGNDRMFVTGWLGQINLESGELTYVSAGHPFAMLKRKEGGFAPLTLNQNKPLSAFEDTSYRQTTLMLEEGDVIFLYTDGVLDAERAGVAYGENKLIESLDRNIRKYGKMEDFVTAVRGEIFAFEDEGEQKDDLTMLALCYKGRKSAFIDHIM